jgi:hypothetical protein
MAGGRWVSFADDRLDFISFQKPMTERGSLFAPPRRGVVGVALTLTFLAAACGDGDGGERQPTGPAATGPTATETMNRPSPAGLRYENEDLGFTVEYPESWVADKSPQQTGVVVLFYATESAGDGFAENVNVVGPEELQLDFTSKQYGKAGWENFRPLLRNVDVIEQRDLTIEGAPAFSIEYEADFQGQRLHWLQAFLVDGRRGFVLTYTGRAGEFDTYRADAEAVIGSFRLN